MKSISLKIEVEPHSGCDIGTVSKEVCDVAKLLDEDVHFKFNGVELRARPTSDFRDMQDMYSVLLSHPKAVGKDMNNRQRKKLSANEHNEAYQKWIDEAPQRAEEGRLYANSKEGKEAAKLLAMYAAMAKEPDSPQRG